MQKLCIVYFSVGLMLSLASAINIELHKRILGGTNQTNPYPFFSIIRFHAKHSSFCGGTLLSENYLLTAAHCFRSWQKRVENCTWGSFPKWLRWTPFSREYYKSRQEKCKQLWLSDIKISANVIDAGDISDTGAQTAQQQGVEFKAVNLKRLTYSDMYWGNDIAILTVEPVAGTEKFISRLKFPTLDTSGGANYLDKELMVLGHGKTCTNEESDQIGSRILQGKKVKVLDDALCDRYLRPVGGLPRRTETEQLLCAIGTDVQPPACHGDSGGPLFYQDEDNLVLVGIVTGSLRAGCQESQHPLPSIFQRISYYSEQIRGLMSEDD